MGRPFAIGISGDSGAGKTTLLKLLSDTLGNNKVIVIEGDGDHKWERNAIEWNEITHLNPKANYLYKQAVDIQTLKSGQSINRHDYDHKTGKFTSLRHLRPKPYIILSSLHAFYLPQMREIFDLKVFLSPEEKLRRYWKISRDIHNRGYSKKTISEQLASRAEDSKNFIQPQIQYADLVIQYFAPNMKDEFESDLNPSIWLRFILSSALNLEPVIN